MRLINRITRYIDPLMMLNSARFWIGVIMVLDAILRFFNAATASVYWLPDDTYSALMLIFGIALLASGNIVRTRVGHLITLGAAVFWAALGGDILARNGHILLSTSGINCIVFSMALILSIAHDECD
jgi:hypothetical protein